MSELIDQQIAKGNLTKSEKDAIDSESNHILRGKYTVPDDELSKAQAKRHLKMNKDRIAPRFR